MITNKIDDETLKFNLFSIYGALLESKIIFPRNIDMRKLLDKLSLSRPILDYLIKARPQVISRMITEILKMNHSQLIVLLSETEKFINRFEVENKLVKKEKDKSNSNSTKKDKKPKRENYIDELLNKYSRRE